MRKRAKWETVKRTFELHDRPSTSLRGMCIYIVSADLRFTRSHAPHTHIVELSRSRVLGFEARTLHIARALPSLAVEIWIFRLVAHTE